MQNTIPHHAFDVIIIGAGGAGLRAALVLSQANVNVAVVSKVFPTRSHTVSAQGGITAALGNVDDDHWHWHMYDTVKGSDYLGDQDAIEYMCQVGPECVYELEQMGLPFSRLPDGKIYQRPFGGQSKNFGNGGQATRTSAAADRTGHALLHTLYQQNLKYKTQFFSEWIALDLIRSSSGETQGVSVLCMETGELAVFRAPIVVIATGGAGQIFESTTNAYINTGDGAAIALRSGIALQDMEMWQFHPTGIFGSGCLISEACRGEGGYLVNSLGERFMERYAPSAKDLASRDVVSRAIAVEIKEGRGCGVDKNYIHLCLNHLPAELIEHKLPGIRDLAITFAKADPISDPIPVVPTCHYMMGGIPTNMHGQVIETIGGQNRIVKGLYAIGECACVSVHGANRLGGNSLLDLVVFGRAAAQHILRSALSFNLEESNFLLEDLQIERAFSRYHKWNNQTGSYTVAEIRHGLQKVMQEHFGVFRDEPHMKKGLDRLHELYQQCNFAVLADKSFVFNTARLEALELDNLFAVALATAYSALERQESRGAHAREDFPKRNDAKWLKHILADHNGNIAYREVNAKPQTVEPFIPKERIY